MVTVHLRTNGDAGVWNNFIMVNTHPTVAAIWISQSPEVCPNAGERQGDRETPVVTWAGRRDITARQLRPTFGE